MSYALYVDSFAINAWIKKKYLMNVYNNGVQMNV